MGFFLSMQSVLEQHWHPFLPVSCGVRHSQLTLSSEQWSRGFFPSNFGLPGKCLSVMTRFLSSDHASSTSV